MVRFDANLWFHRDDGVCELVVYSNRRLRQPGTEEDQPRKMQVGIWDHYGWSPPDNFDDPDPEIEAMFHGEGGDAEAS